MTFGGRVVGMSTKYHAVLTKDVDGIPSELLPKDKRHAAWAKGVYAAGMRLYVYRERQRKNTMVTVRGVSEWWPDQGECQWIEKREAGGIRIVPLPTEQQVKDMGWLSANGRRGIAQRRFAQDIHDALSDPVHDLQSVLDGSQTDFENILINLFRKDKITLADIEEADHKIEGDES